jgi:hypothetical protein
MILADYLKNGWVSIPVKDGRYNQFYWFLELHKNDEKKTVLYQRIKKTKEERLKK